MLYFSRAKAAAILLTALVICGLMVPNFIADSTLKSWPAWAQRRLVLGLDLQGGSHILLQVDKGDVQKQRLDTLRDEVRRTLRDARIQWASAPAVRGNSIEVRMAEGADFAAGYAKLRALSQPLGGLLQGQSGRTLDVTDAGDGLVRLTVTEAAMTDRTRQAVEQSIPVIEKRINQLGLVEPTVQRQGIDRILVQVPGLGDPQRLLDIIGKTAKLEFRMVDSSGPEAPDHVAADSEVLEEKRPGQPPIKVVVKKQALVEGVDLTDAQAGFDQQNGQPIVNFKFNSIGARKFGRATTENVGRQFAIVLDNQVISAPVINEPIPGGSGRISGSFTVETANDLAILLRAGALPAKLEPIEQRVVGPGLGQDSIRAGENASIAGAILVVLFMLAVYGLFGLFANIAVTINVAMILGILSFLGATLTLPGIAGIVLTVGIAVDSNVLIYERIREEVRNGRNAISAIDAGFSRALATILDSNITTFIAAAVLFLIGTGPVKGFAVTLGIGILTSLFTAFTLTRLIVAWWVSVVRPRTVNVHLLRIIPEDTHFGFLRFRRFSFPASALLSIVAITLYFTHGLNFGIDFKGGTLMEVQSKSGSADIAKMRSTLGGLDVGEVQLQELREFGGPPNVLIRLAQQPGGEQAQQAAVEKVKNALGDEVNYRRIEVVGPRVSGELLHLGIVGIFAAIGAILVYLWFRFEWQFALGAMIANVHDIVLTLGFMSITQIDFDLTSIAALLTILGYSLNDTVVIYDRIREMLRRYKKMPMTDLLNASINATLSRSIITHLTVALSLLALLLFGGQAIHSFAATMLFGVVLVGTYTSVFIASPILIYLGAGTGRQTSSAADEIAVETPVPGRAPAPAR
jgi:SecD/SecF fusion protein